MSEEGLWTAWHRNTRQGPWIRDCSASSPAEASRLQNRLLGLDRPQATWRFCLTQGGYPHGQ